MGETRRRFDQDFREGAVRLVRETGKPITQVARDLGICSGTLENWMARDRRQLEGGDGRLGESSGPSWRGFAANARNCAWNGTCSSDRSLSGYPANRRLARPSGRITPVQPANRRENRPSRLAG
jgi:transposase-like protein